MHEANIKKRSAVFAPISLWESHQAEALELAISLSKKGEEVFIFHCREVIRSCAANPKKEFVKCKECIFQFENSRRLLENEKVNIKIVPIDPKSIRMLKICTDELATGWGNLIKFQYKEHPFGKFIVSDLMVQSRDLYLDDSLLVKAHEMLANSINLYEYFLIQLRILNINEVWVWNGRRAADVPLVFAARDLGIDSQFFITGSKWGKLSVQRKPLSQISGITEAIVEWRNKRLANDQRSVMESEGREFFNQLKTGQSQLPGYINFMRDNQKLNSDLVLDESKKNLVLFTSSMWEYSSEPEFKEINPEFFDHYEVYRYLCSNDFILSKYNLIVRWHPNLVTAGKGELIRQAQVIDSSPRAIHILQVDKVNSYGLLEKANLVVTCGSTMGIEAVAMGKPSILLGTAAYKGLGSVYEPTNFSDFLRIISNDVLPLNQEGAWAYGDWTKNFGNFFSYVNHLEGKNFLNGVRIHRKLPLLFKFYRRFLGLLA